MCCFFFSSRRRHTRCALVTGVQTCALPIWARRGDSLARPSSQSSVAVSADGENWILLNASPDLRQQIFERRQLHPRDGVRHSPIRAVVLTNGDVDHVAGLLTLRESHPLEIGRASCRERVWQYV